MDHYTIFTILLVWATSVVGQNNTSNNSLILDNNNSTKSGKIVGGYYTDIIYYPYQLQLKTDTNTCGGSILSQYWALTAAHCVSGVRSAVFRAGTSFWDVGGTLHPVQRIISHPSYNTVTHNNDIAVARVSIPFVFGPKVAPVVIPAVEAPAGTPVVVTGWGSYSYYQGPTPSQLKALDEKIVSRSICNTVYPSMISSGMICASAPSAAACSGDSGGPLANGRYQFGVVSWGDRCSTTRPDVYANVAFYSSWIKSVTGI